VAPDKVGGHRKSVLEPHRDFIIERTGQTPHPTLHGLRDVLAARGVKVSHNAVWLFLRREGLRCRKTCPPSNRHAPTLLAGDSDGGLSGGVSDPGRLVFIDETWIETSMADQPYLSDPV
jgi:transposase